jgi:hypothetical protein
LRETMESSELCFLFLDGDAMGAGQQAEVDALEARLMARKEVDYPIVPVLLRSNQSPKLPTFLSTRQWAKLEDLTDRELRQILCSHFPKRCPGDWESRPGGWGSRPGDTGKVRLIETPVQPPPIQPPPVQPPPVERRLRGED